MRFEGFKIPRKTEYPPTMHHALGCWRKLQFSISIIFMQVSGRNSTLKNYLELKPPKFFDCLYEGGDIFKGSKIDVVGR